MKVRIEIETPHNRYTIGKHYDDYILDVVDEAWLLHIRDITTHDVTELILHALKDSH